MMNFLSDIIVMLKDHWFWGMITIACLVWYSTITIYVSIKGVSDIRSMLKELSKHR
jgi:hypothetical protein